MIRIYRRLFEKAGRNWRSGRRIRPNRRGAAAVELALVMPILLTVVFGVIQYGMVIHTRHVMVYAAREAARSYAVGESDADEAETLALNRLSDTPFSYTVAVTEPGSGESDVTVSISLPMAEAAIDLPPRFVPYPMLVCLPSVLRPGSAAAHQQRRPERAGGAE